jgi:hypothetical protein
MLTALYFFFLSPLLKWLGFAGLIAAGGFFVYFATPRLPAWFPINLEPFRNIGGIVALAAVAFMLFASHFFNAGQRHMAQRIASKDQAAIARVTDALREVNACGEDWDQSTGTCMKGSFR